jgi:hypothetical protein
LVSSPVDTSAPPRLVIHPPLASRDSSSEQSQRSSIDLADEADFANAAQDGFTPTADIPLTPLRVVYSPAVSRGGSSEQARRSPVAESEMDLASKARLSLHDEESASSPIPRPFVSPTIKAYTGEQPGPATSEGEDTIQPHQETRSHIRNSLPENLKAGVQTSTATLSPLPLQGNRASAPAEIRYQEAPLGPVFLAFPGKKWLPPMVIAKVSLAITTCSVLANFIYT